MPSTYKPHNARAGHEFRRAFDEVKELGTTGVFPGTGGEGAETAYYMPDDVFNGYFSDDRVKHIIAQLYKDGRSGFLRVQPSAVRRDYRRILAILLFIDQGDMIEYFVQAPELNDQKLPFTSRPAIFPDSTGASFFGEFQKVQWKFCVPKIYDCERVVWPPDYILPFVRIGRPLGRGHSGKAYRIEIHPAHDRLDPDQGAPRIDGPSNGNIRQHGNFRAVERDPLQPKAYVLKTFHPRRGSEAQWSHEVEAHVRLRSTLRRDPGIIWFHHCYTHGKTCNVILELAPLGDLEDVLQRLEPPKTREDIMLFWRSFLRLLETLAYLRDMTYEDKSAYQLCHFDLKPQNILVCPGDSGSPYDLHFKIGDFGSSNFCVLRNDSATYAEYYPGTRTFGAPECYDWNPFSDTTRTIQKVLPDADMWSLGAIALEIAEWMRSGPSGITWCRQCRRKAHRSNPGFQIADCFHDGKDVLRCVETHMETLIKDCDPGDATGAVVQLIRKYMLVAIPEARMGARHLQIEADNALSAVRSHWAAASRLPSSINNGQIRGTTNPPLTVRTSTDRPTGHPQSPPDPTSFPRDQANGWPSHRPSPSHSIGKNGGSTSSSTSPQTTLSRNASNISSTSGTQVQALPRDLSGPRTTVSPQLASRNPFRMAQFAVQMPIIHQDPTILADPFVDSQPRRGGQREHRSISADQNNRGSFPSLQFNGSPSNVERTSSGLPVPNALGLDPIGHPAADRFWPNADQSNPAYHANRWPSMYDQATAGSVQPVTSDPKQSGSQMSNFTEGAGSDTARLSSTSEDSASKAKSKRHSEVEVLRLDEAQERLQSVRKSKSKFRGFSREKPEPGKLEQYQDRDFIILVDDSTSMNTHWPKVVDCAKLLADYTTPYDDNGIEIRFMKNYRSKRVTKDPDLIKSLVRENRPPRNGEVMISQIDNVLDCVLGEYRRNLESKPSMLNKVLGRKEKKLIVFVLTNGETCLYYDAKGPIFDLVETLRAQKRAGNHVGIQFVRFGDNEEAKARLTELDDFLNPHAHPSLAQYADNRDIVDVEPWEDVNVLKLLLGSIDKLYDRADSPVPSTPTQRRMSPPTDVGLQSPTSGAGSVGSPSSAPMSRSGSNEGEQRRPPPFHPQYYQYT